MKRLARLFAVAALALSALVLATGSAGAATVTISPWAYACGTTVSGNPISVQDNPGEGACPATDTLGNASASYSGGVLTLSKTGPTSDDLASGATVGGLTTLTAASFDISGYCGAGAPRLNVVTSDGKIHFFGCSANNTAGVVVLDLTAAGDGAGNGGVIGKTVTSINFVQDEGTCTPVGDCQDNPAVLSHIVLVGTGPVASPSPVPCNSTASAARCPSPAPTPKPPTTGVGYDSDPLPLVIGALVLIAISSSLILARRRS